MSEYTMMPLAENVEEMFIGPFGSSLKNDCFVDEENGFCMVYEQKHAIQKTMDVETRFVDEKKYNELKRFNIHGGDIIVSCRGTIGETFVVPEDAPLGIMHPSIMKIRLKDGVYDKFYFNLLLQKRLKGHEAEANGSGIKMAISAKALGAELFPVPTMKEQKQITDVISKVQRIIDARQMKLVYLDELIKARFVEMFGDIKTNSLGWETKTFDECFDITSSKRILKSEWKAEGIPFLRVRDMVQLATTGTMDNEFFVSEAFYATLSDSDGIPRTGDILVSATSTLGKCHLVKEGERFYFKDADVLRFRIKEKIEPQFFIDQLKSDYIEEQIARTLGVTTVAHFTIKAAKTIKLRIPKVELQEEYAKFVKQVEKSKAVVQKALDKAQLLFDSLMQKYFG